jgi:hypothetical protein
LCVLCSSLTHAGLPAVHHHGCGNYRRGSLILPFSPTPTTKKRADYQRWLPNFGTLPSFAEEAKTSSNGVPPASLCPANRVLYYDLVLLITGNNAARIKSWIKVHSQCELDEQDLLCARILARASNVIVLWHPPSNAGAVLSREMFTDNKDFTRLYKLKLLIESGHTPSLESCRSFVELELEQPAMNQSPPQEQQWIRNKLQAALCVAGAFLEKNNPPSKVSSHPSPRAKLTAEACASWDELATPEIIAAVRIYARSIELRPELKRALRRQVPSCDRVKSITPTRADDNDEWSTDRFLHPPWSGIGRLRFMTQISGPGRLLHVCALAEYKGLRSLKDRVVSRP